MAKIGRPLGLIRYDTEKGLRGEKTRFIRPRVLVYATILCLLFFVFTYSLSTRQLSEAQILHASKDVLFNVMPDGKIENHLEVHLSNKDSVPHQFTIESAGNDIIQLVAPLNPFPVAAESIAKAPLFINFPKEILKGGKAPISITVRDEKNFSITVPLTLIGPG